MRHMSLVSIQTFNKWLTKLGSKWVCIYPLYINSRKTVAEGRRLPKDKSVDNPTYSEMKDVLTHSGLNIGVEAKTHPKEHDHRYRGRIRIQIKDEEGKVLNEKFPDRKSVMLYCGETIPKLKARIQAQGQQQQQQQQQKKGGKNKKGKR